MRMPNLNSKNLNMIILVKKKGLNFGTQKKRIFSVQLELLKKIITHL